MINLDDTIVAISTPIGEGAIGIVRLSGKDALNIASKIFVSPKGKDIKKVSSHTIHYGYIVDPENGEKIDEVLVSVMRAPYTYTREEIVEFNCHGGVVPLRRVLEIIIKQGARLAKAGEFTMRAFLNGRIDLSQAEATIDLIKAKTDRSSRIAIEQLRGILKEKINIIKDKITNIAVQIEAYIDFPEEEIEFMNIIQLRESIKEIIKALENLSYTYKEGRFFKDGLSVAIIGRPNVGKSSLLNTLLQKNRVIVTEIPGTTRDVIEEFINLNGVPLRIMDTCGIREAFNIAESEGVKRSLRVAKEADLILAVFDISEQLKEEDRFVIEKIDKEKTIIVLNKIDLPEKVSEKEFPKKVKKVKISAKTGKGIGLLKKEIERNVLKGGISSDGVIIVNLRHKIAIDNAVSALKKADKALSNSMPFEIIAIEIKDAIESLGEITGEVTTEDILNKIFNQFCIGK